MPIGEMVITLGQNPEPLPAWLQHQSRPKFDRKNFFGSRTVYYPGARYDVDPVRLCAEANAAHTFFFVDNGVKLQDIRRLLHELGDRGFRGYDVEHEYEFEELALLTAGWTSHVHETDLLAEVKRAIESEVEGTCVILRRDLNFDQIYGPQRLVLLYVIGDGHIMYDAFYCQDDGTPAPFLIVVQDHGMAGNYSRFARGGLLECLAYQRCRYPDWLLVGSIDNIGNSYEPWDGYTDTGVAPELQGEALNPRKLYRREEDCPLFVTRQSRHTRQNGIVESMTRPTLKHEVHDILMAQGNGWMKLRDIANLVNERALYQSRTGSPVTNDELFAIQRKHRQLFERDSTRIRCRENGQIGREVVE